MKNFTKKHLVASFQRLLPLYIGLLVSSCSLAQERSDPQSLAQMEMQAHAAQFTGALARTEASENFDVKYYRCEWEIDPAVRYINGKVTVYYKTVAPASSITLDLMSVLIVDAVSYHGSPLAFTQPANTLVINFPATVNAGVLDSVSIAYHGVPASTGFGSFIQTTHAGVPVTWSLSEAYGARDWWPCKNGINDKADSVDVYLTYPSQYRGASNGLLQSETAVSGSRTTAHWKHRYPIATYLICMAVTNYSVFNNSVQLGSVNLPMLTYCYPENLAAFQANTPKVLEAMQLFHNSFGPYPFINEKYGHVQFNFGGGMEHQTTTFVINTDESLMAHELGHQWFGDKVTCYSWEDIWLNEGFATFLAAFHMESKYPESAVANRRAILANVVSAPGGAVKVADTTVLGNIFSQRLTYNKGSKLLYMLRFILGDGVFFKALRRYQADPALAYGNAKTADLRRNLEAESGRDLGYFFDQWYTGEGYPSYDIKWKPIGSGTVDVQINQTTSHPSVPFFHLPVPLKFKSATREKTIVLDNTFSGQSFLSTLGFVPDSVFVDPDCWLVTKNNTVQQLAVTNTGVGAADIYPNPLSDPFSIYLHDFPRNDAAINIYNAAGQEMYRRQITMVNGAEIISVPVSGWAHGMYVVKIVAAGKTFVRQVVR